jgi:hypothetical protein
MFGSVKDALHRYHFADDSELKQSFHHVPHNSGREFYNTDIQYFTQRWQKCVESDRDLWKSSLIIAKDV